MLILQAAAQCIMTSSADTAGCNTAHRHLECWYCRLQHSPSSWQRVTVLLSLLMVGCRTVRLYTDKSSCSIACTLSDRPSRGYCREKVQDLRRRYMFVVFTFPYVNSNDMEVLRLMKYAKYYSHYFKKHISFQKAYIKEAYIKKIKWQDFIKCDEKARIIILFN